MIRSKKLLKIGGITLLTVTLFTGVIFSNKASLVVAKKDEPITTSETDTSSKKQETINEDISKSEEVICEEPVTDIVYTTTSLNVRTEPNGSKRVGLLEPNSELTRVEDNDGWDAIEVAGVKYYVCDKYLTSTKPETIKKVTELKPIVETSAPAKTQYTSGQGSKYIGKFKLTAYCACSKCCGQWADANATTASGTHAVQGRTVACNSLPFGTRIVINGNVYVVEDRGGMANNVIDVFFNSHQEALNFGVKYADVYYAD
jgi:3D (Asp-Asp-Asp) domain-containing protein